jgi:hypothetical protein
MMFQSLSDIGRRDQATAAFQLLSEVLGREKIKLADLPHTLDEANGQLIVDGMTFVYTASKLRVLGYCPLCGSEVPSNPIRRAADIVDAKDRFYPMNHDCSQP